MFQRERGDGVVHTCPCSWALGMQNGTEKNGRKERTKIPHACRIGEVLLAQSKRSCQIMICRRQSIGEPCKFASSTSRVALDNASSSSVMAAAIDGRNHQLFASVANARRHRVVESAECGMFVTGTLAQGGNPYRQYRWVDQVAQHIWPLCRMVQVVRS